LCLVAILIVGLRTHRILRNMLAWFLGMVTYFAAKLDLAVTSFMHLAIATGIGACRYAYQDLNRRFADNSTAFGSQSKHGLCTLGISAPDSL
jgi:hypothetical protein